MRIEYGITTETECCLNCKNYCAHYVYMKESNVPFGMTPIAMGHCMKPRFKNRRITDVCEGFEKDNEPDKRMPHGFAAIVAKKTGA